MRRRSGIEAGKGVRRYGRQEDVGRWSEKSEEKRGGEKTSKTNECKKANNNNNNAAPERRKYTVGCVRTGFQVLYSWIFGMIIAYYF